MRAIDAPSGMGNARLEDMQSLSPYEMASEWVFQVGRRRDRADHAERQTVKLELSSARLCLCGCGQTPKSGTNGVRSKWLVGHHRRGIGGYAL